jgi:acetolactate synthase II small subunit
MFEMNLLIANTEGALIRVLGTIERRGFALGAISSQHTAQGLRLSVSVEAEGRAADVLVRQLRRVIDIREVSLELPRPAFQLPPQPARAANASSMAASSRSGLSFLGIPDRIPISDAVFA